MTKVSKKTNLHALIKYFDGHRSLKAIKDYQLKPLIPHIWNQGDYMEVLRITQALLNGFDLKANHKRVYH